MTKEKKLLKKDAFLFLLIFILFAFPLFKIIYSTFIFAESYNFSYLRIIGLIGVFFLTFNIDFKIYKADDKKACFKELLPIFLLIIYMFWTLISCNKANNQYLAFHGTFYRLDGYISYIAYAGCFGLAFCISSKKIRKLILYTFALTAVLNAFFTQISSLGQFFRFFVIKDVTLSSFFNTNHYGYYLLTACAVISFLFISEKRKNLKIANLLMYVYLLYFLIINNTFGCYLALIFSLILFLVTAIIKKEKKWPVLVLIAIFVLASIFVNKGTKNVAGSNIQSFEKDIFNIFSKKSSTDFPTKSSVTNSNYPFKEVWLHAGSGRIGLWLKGLELIAKKPFFGYGPENLESEYAKYGIKQDRPHNLIIQLATTSGIPGLILYACAIGIILWRSLKNLDFNNQVQVVCTFSIIAYLVSAMFGNSMYTTSPNYFILLGLLFSEVLRIQKNAKGDGAKWHM